MTASRFSGRELLGSAAVLRQELEQLCLDADATELRPVAVRIDVPDGFEWRPIVPLAVSAGATLVGGTGGLLLTGSAGSCRTLSRLLEELHPDLASAIESAMDRRQPVCLEARRRSIPLGSRTLIMGILNLSPDSFSGDGLADAEGAVRQAQQFLDAGADILDVGAMSTRPGSEPIPEDVEAARLNSAIGAIRSLTDRILSADTYRVGPARAAMDAGADIINDITGLRNQKIAELAASYGAGVVVMHMQGTPSDMQLNPRYKNVVGEVYDCLSIGISTALAAGIAPEGIVVDPGIGFGKTTGHNIELLHRLREFAGLGQPVLVGTSRKGFIGRVTGQDVGERLLGTATTVALAIGGGADIVRVHDVQEMAVVGRMSDALARWDGNAAVGARER